MRRLRDRRPATFFRGAQLARLLTLVVMLGMLLVLMDRARDPNMWRWIAQDDTDAETPAADARPQRPAVYDAQPTGQGPTDQDPLQRDAAGEEFGAVTDKAPLGKAEMPAYWRQMAWARNQPTDALVKRADKDVTFAQLCRQPEKWRGKLVEIPVHLQRTRVSEDLPENRLAMKTLFEAWGWNDQSQSDSYRMVVPQLPRGMPQGENIAAEATFVGYFLKLLSHEDRQGKMRSTPLLIGRLIWHPTPTSPLARRDEWTWTWYIIAALAVLFVVRWSLVLLGRRGSGTSGTGPVPSSDERAVEAWLEGDTHRADPPIASDTSSTDVVDDRPGSR